MVLTASAGDRRAPHLVAGDEPAHLGELGGEVLLDAQVHLPPPRGLAQLAHSRQVRHLLEVHVNLQLPVLVVVHTAELEPETQMFVHFSYTIYSLLTDLGP